MALGGSPTRIVVTGATGYIGSRLALRLRDSGADVVPSGRRADLKLEAAGLRLHRADLCDESATRALIEGADIVVHCAAWMGSRGEKGASHRVNVDAAARLARLCANAAVGRLVHLSSIAACGPPRGRLRIGSTTPPDTTQDYPYGRSKALGEEAVRSVAMDSGLPLVIVRPGIVHGPGCGPWTRNLQRLVRRGVPVLFGDGGGLAPLIYIDNLIDILLACVFHPDAPGRTFHACDAPVTWRQLFQAHGHHAGRSPRSIPVWLARAAAWLGEAAGLSLPISRHRLDFVLAQADYRDAEPSCLGVLQRVSFAEAMQASWRYVDAER